MTDSTDPTRREGGPTDRPASNHDTDDEEVERPERSERGERSDQDHLRGIEDGCGCAEVWEHLSEQRERNRAEQGKDRKEDIMPATGEE